MSNQQAYINYRIEKAYETYDVAALLVENTKWNSAINRLYYSCFYMVSALLTKSNLESKSHSGIKSQFFLHFVKSGLVSKEFGKMYSDLFDWRQKGDYGDFFDFEKQQVEPLLVPVKDFLNIILQIIKEK
jgi:uncharacterized protein (UPF0332 family)